MINTFEPKLVGNTIVMTTKFYDENHTEIVPDTVTFKYMLPDGTSTVIPISRVNNKYSTSVLLSTSGIWKFRWECSGTYASADEFTVNVRESAFV